MKDKYYENIKEQLINNEIYKRIKDYSKNKSDLFTYYTIGKELFEAGRHYGEDIINKYSIKLTYEFGKGYNTTNLKRFRKFYTTIEKGATLWHQLSWSHYRSLITLNDINAINYYSNKCIEESLSVRELQIIINMDEYYRLPKNTKNKLTKNSKSSIKDSIPNPIIIKNNNKRIINEKHLHCLIMEDISSFMRELGQGYSYIDSEYKIRIDDRYNYIDFLLYNIKYKCYVVIELKISELKSEYIGQIQKYMNYVNKNIKSINENNTIGIIICKRNNRFYMEYCSDKRIISREYKLI